MFLIEILQKMFWLSDPCDLLTTSMPEWSEFYDIYINVNINKDPNKSTQKRLISTDCTMETQGKQTSNDYI